MTILTSSRRSTALLGVLGILLVVASVEAVPVCAPTGHCYDTSTAQGLPPGTWAEAQAGASTVSFNGQPGHLATITSLEESVFIAESFPSLFEGVSGPWFGLFQSAAGVEPGTPSQGAAGGWQWVTLEPFYAGEAVIFHNWASEEPNEFQNAGEDFGQFFIGADAQGYQWNDLPGTSTLAFLIEFEPATGASVPEPTALLLLGSGLVGLVAVARRHRRR